MRDRIPKVGEVLHGNFADYKLLEVLGDGGYGTVFGSNLSGRSVAVKVEKYSQSMLFVEEKVLRAANGKNMVHICEMIDYKVVKGEFVFLVMTRLGKDLHKLKYEMTSRRFSTSTALRIGIQSLEAIRELHCGYFISRDIKPGNFSPGYKGNQQNHIIYMFDFGLSRRYIDTNNNHVPERGSVGWRGTTRYGSLNAHMKKDLGRRDDLESWFYMLVEVTTGALPWRTLTVRTSVEDMKRDARNNRKFLEGCPESYATVEDPPYKEYEEILRKECWKRGIRDNDAWDWDDSMDMTGPVETANEHTEHSGPSEDRSNMCTGKLNE